MFAAGGAETGLGLVLWLHGSLLQYGDMLLLVSQVVHLTPHYCDVLAELLEVFKDGCELLSDDVSVEELSVPLVLVLSALELPEGELGKDTEDSLVVVSVTGCKLAG